MRTKKSLAARHIVSTACISGLLLLLLLLNLILFYRQSEKKMNVFAATTIYADSKVSVSIGEFRFILFGYTSPYAVVTLEGMGIYDQTIANDVGYFVFANRFSPFSPREACLSSKDQLGRLSAPACLPPFPTKYNVNIGPVLLPPTVSLNQPNYYLSDEVILSGQTIPNSQVDLSFFTDTTHSLHEKLASTGIFQAMFTNGFSLQSKLSSILKSTIHPKTVYAYSLPPLELKSDSEGNFSLQLPSSEASKYRVFTRARYNEQFSPNSNSLHLEVLPVWMIILQWIRLIWELLKDRLIELILLLELLFLSLYLLARYRKKQFLSIIPYETHSPMLISEQPHTLMKLENQ